MQTINIKVNHSGNFSKIMTFDGTKLRTNSPPPLLNNQARALRLKGYVGFDKLASQYVNKSNNDGYCFNILCVGETGIGKSTLMDTLFNTNFNIKPSSHSNETVTLNSNTYELDEKNISLRLTIIETSGFGDQINKENSHEEIVNYLDKQFEDYVQQELGLKRTFKQIDDTRVHVCLYFICPTGHSLKAIDLNTMKALDRKCNIIPIIAKADTISKNELIEFKKKIMNELSSNHVNIYQFPINDYDLNISNLNASTNALFPLAVIGSSDFVKIGNKITRGRQYEWGTVSVENESHCDFLKLREMLLSINMIDLIEGTHTKHYQLYRSNRLKEIGFSDDLEDEYVNTNDDSMQSNRFKSIEEVFSMKKTELTEDIQKKEMQIKEDFIKKVKDKELEIREAETELNNKYAKWKKETAERSECIETKRKELENEMREFSERKFTLERCKISTLNGNGKCKKK